MARQAVKAKTDSSGSVISVSIAPENSPWLSFKPIRYSKTRARSNPEISALSSASTTATAALKLPVMSVIISSTISEVRGYLAIAIHVQSDSFISHCDS